MSVGSFPSLAAGSMVATPMRKASILAILNTASVALSRPEEGRQAISDAREILDKIIGSGRVGAEVEFRFTQKTQRVGWNIHVDCGR